MRAHRVALVGISLVLGFFVFSTGGVDATSAHAAQRATSPWRTFPGASVDAGAPMLGVGWAASRVWAVTVTKQTPIVHSARASGGTLAGATATPIPGDLTRYSIVADALVLNGLTKGSNRTQGQFTAHLLANGRVGEPTPLPDDLTTKSKAAVPKVETVRIHAGVPVGSRAVWVLEGDPECGSINGCPVFFLACCNASGAAVDLTRFMGDRRGFFTIPPTIGRDERGRISLAWLDRKDSPGAVLGVPRLLELDPTTLAPRSQAVAIPGVRATRIQLACAASCRLVAQSTRGEIVSWTHGERSPTLVVRGWRPTKIAGSIPDAQLIAAAYRSGRLLVAYHGSRGKTQYADETVRHELRVLRGDARGGRAGVVKTLPYPYGWPAGKLDPPFLDAVVEGVFTPNGLVTVGYFRDSRTYAPSPVVYTIARLGG